MTPTLHHHQLNTSRITSINSWHFVSEHAGKKNLDIHSYNRSNMVTKSKQKFCRWFTSNAWKSQSKVNKYFWQVYKRLRILHLHWLMPNHLEEHSFILSQPELRRQTKTTLGAFVRSKRNAIAISIRTCHFSGRRTLNCMLSNIHRSFGDLLRWWNEMLQKLHRVAKLLPYDTVRFQLISCCQRNFIRISCHLFALCFNAYHFMAIHYSAHAPHRFQCSCARIFGWTNGGEIFYPWYGFISFIFQWKHCNFRGFDERKRG